jgi:hypothetical protein
MAATYLYLHTTKQSTAQESIHWILLQQQLEAERLKRQAIAHEMLAHSLNPMQPQTVQHSTRSLHYAENSYCKEEPVPLLFSATA